MIYEERKSKLQRIKNGAEVVLSAMSVHFPSLKASVRYLANEPKTSTSNPPGTNPDDERPGREGAPGSGKRIGQTRARTRWQAGRAGVARNNP